MAPPWPTVRFPLYHQPNVDGFVSSRRKKSCSSRAYTHKEPCTKIARVGGPRRSPLSLPARISPLSTEVCLL